MTAIPSEAMKAGVRAAVDAWPPSGEEPMRSYVQAILEAAAPFLSPPAVIKFDRDLTPEMAEEIAARWKAAWERDKNKPYKVLGTDVEVIVGYMVDGKMYHPADVTIVRMPDLEDA